MTNSSSISDDSLLTVLHDVADAVAQALESFTEWRLMGERPSQYKLDLVADAAALAVLERAGLGVLSEESGLHRADAGVVVVVDPVDGSTNASLRLPWYATALCAVAEDGARAAVVVNQATGVRYEAVRGGGARRDGVPIRPSTCVALADAIVGLNGHAPRHLGWRQYRVLGAAALELCAVADGSLDAYADLNHQLRPWDYLGAMLVCQEAGAPIVDLGGHDLLTTAFEATRAPVAAASASLLGELQAAINE